MNNKIFAGNEAIRKKFGENLRDLRKSRGYSQEKFAKELGVAQASVSAWELGTREPEFSVVFEISKVFRVPVSSLIPICESGMEEDAVQETVDLVRQNPRLRVTFDKMKHFDKHKMNVVLGVVDAIAKGNNE